MIDYVTFAYPYSIFLSSEWADAHGLEEDNCAELTFDTTPDIEDPTVHGRVRDLETFDPHREIHALTYTLQELTHPPLRDDQLSRVPFEIPESVRETTEEDTVTYSELDVSNHDEAFEILETIDSFVTEQTADCDVIVGAGLIEFTLPESRTPQVATPRYSMGVNAVLRILERGYFPMVDLQSYVREPPTPGTVYFSTERHKPTERQQERLRERLAEVGIVDTSREYRLPDRETFLRGPAQITDPDRVAHNLIRLEKEAIEFVHSPHGHILPEEDQEQPLPYESIDTVLEQGGYVFEWGQKNDVIVQIPGEKEAEVRFWEASNGWITFDIRYPYDDQTEREGQEIVETVVDTFDEMIDGSVTGHFHLTDPILGSKPTMWQFDTNSLYRVDPSETRECLFDFLLRNYQLYRKTFRVPWEVLFEINKHAGDASAAQRNSERGRDNIRLLKTLEEMGFFEVDIESIPADVDNRVSGTKGVRDLTMLGKLSGDEGILTHDQSYIDLAEILGVRACRPDELLTGREDAVETDPWEAIREFLDNGAASVSDLESHLFEQSGTTEPLPDFTRDDFHGLLRQKRGPIRHPSAQSPPEQLTFYAEDSVQMVALAEPVEVLVTADAAEKLVTDMIERIDGEDLLPKDLLVDIRERHDPIADPIWPAVTLTIRSKDLFRVAGEKTGPNSETTGDTSMGQLHRLHELYNADFSVHHPETTATGSQASTNALMSQANALDNILIAAADETLDDIDPFLNIEVISI